uniref:Uncharacterized protein n=1 Tax=Anopheles quadriannulatus TaxID=34691 RepID=A0A182XQC7_ANOQN
KGTAIFIRGNLLSAFHFYHVLVCVIREKKGEKQRKSPVSVCVSVCV